MIKTCFHCGEAIPNGYIADVTINGKQESMCCIGCQSVAEMIVTNKLTDYYRYRTSPALKSDSLIPEQLEQKKLLDDESLQSEFTFSFDGYKESILTIEGINCAACAWLIEKQLTSTKGILNIEVNATTQRANIRWNDEVIHLSDIIIAVEKIGYHALPYKANTAEEINKTRSKAFIKRLGISGILMMQVMMIAVGLYFGSFSDMSEHNLHYLRLISFALTCPIVTYGAYPFYKGAINAIKAKRLSMDVPVSIAITLAFSASAWATFSQQGEVYFESVSMFTFLLLIGKFLEFRARAKAAEVSSNLLKMMPLTATKIENGKETLILAKHCLLGDKVLIKPGEIVPADGVIISGTSQLNEAMLTGESLPITKTITHSVFAGTINGDSNLTIDVKNSGQHSFLSQLIKLSESSQAHKPKLAKLSDNIAQYFVAIILITAIACALYWSVHAPQNAFWITLSVLVATCPCALSLATPAALTCATTRLNRLGIMIKSGHVLETIPKVNCMAFDKTGTLTSGEFSIEKIKVLNSNDNYNKSKCLNIAAALESFSEHPIAKAFRPFRNFQDSVSNVEVISGSGIIGKVNDTCFYIGKLQWLTNNCLLNEDSIEIEPNQSQCILAVKKEDDYTIIAHFTLIDEIRKDAAKVLNKLTSEKITTLMISGDNNLGCSKVSAVLPIKHVYSSLSAQEKLNIIHKQQENNIVAMIGDGINDTPVLGAAHLSIAMGCATDITKSGADVILLNNQLKSILSLKAIGSFTRSIVWQNYFWAFSYNLIVLPLAVMGHITPYFAVIGMSVSSLIVITNSLRLLNKKIV